MVNDSFLLIPSRGRWDKQLTLDNLPRKWRKKTALVIAKNQEKKYARVAKRYGVELLVHPSDMNGVGRARHFALTNTDHRYVAVMDDDVKFTVRREDRPDRQRVASKIEVGEGLDTIVEWLKEKNVAQTGFSPAFANCFVKESFLYNQKCNVAWAINNKLYQKMKFGFDDFPLVLEDIHVTLSFLEHGYRTKVLFTHSYTDVLVNTHGGCSDYGTTKLWREECERLHSMHPDYVIIRKNKNHNLKAINASYVTVRWKKAYEDYYENTVHEARRNK